MKHLFTTITVLSLFVNNLTAQDSAAFRKSIFRYSQEELPYAISLGGGIGAGSNGASAGLIAEVDVFHFLIGYKLVFHDLIGAAFDHPLTENSALFGYQYRTRNVMISGSGGIGQLKWKDDYIEYKSECYPVKFEVDYIFSTYAGVGLSMNQTFTPDEDYPTLLFHLKFGIFWSEEY